MKNFSLIYADLSADFRRQIVDGYPVCENLRTNLRDFVRYFLFLRKFSAIRLILLILVLSGNAQAQFYGLPFRPDVVTLWEQLANASGPEETRLYNLLACYHSYATVDSAFWYANKALDLAREQNNRIEEANALRHIGHTLVLESKFREAIARFYQSLAICEELEYERGILEALISIAKVNYDAGDFQRASEYVNQIIPAIDKNNPDGTPLLNPLEKSQLFASFAVVKRENEEYDDAIRFFKEYIALSDELDVSNYLLLHIAFVKSLGETYEYIGNLDSAMKYTLLARGLLPGNAGKREEEKTGYELSIGMLYDQMGDHVKAIPYLQSALISYKENKSHMYVSWCASRLGRIFQEQGEEKLALHYFNQALYFARYIIRPPNQDGDENRQQTVYAGYQLMYLSISEKWIIQKYYESMVRALNNFYTFYLDAGDTVKAYRYFFDLTAYRDSLDILEQDIEFNRMQLRYESDQLEQQVTILSQENELSRMQLRRTIWFIMGLGTVAILVFLFGLIWFRQNRLRDRQHALELEQRLLRTQMNPHFIFNSLASIQNFIVTQEPMKASTYLSRFSNLVRNILNNSVEEYVNFEDEISTIENYLELQKVRFEGKFDFTIDVDPTIDMESMMIPPMLAQPFIENSIEHGFKQKGDKGNLNIRFIKSGENLILFEVEDDGIGRTKARQLMQTTDPRHRSMATSITRDRLMVLNKKLKQKIRLQIIDLKDEAGNATGTKVRFFIPVKS
ncbi:MAG: tetratricopeptide repeat protein [Bacteroidia bacterium]|nr:tetratricopeptide repeat protein [Bacteroidia bacterium]